MNLDQWDSFLAFQGAVRPDLGNYDDDGACKYPPLSQLARIYTYHTC
jgi:hypothetical protein